MLYIFKNSIIFNLNFLCFSFRLFVWYKASLNLIMKDYLNKLIKMLQKQMITI